MFIIKFKMYDVWRFLTVFMELSDKQCDARVFTTREKAVATMIAAVKFNDSLNLEVTDYVISKINR